MPPGVVGLPVMPPTPAYQDIVKITVNYGTTSTLHNPNETLRPYRGDLLRVSIPHSCGATTISQLAAWGRTLQGGQRVQLSLVPMGSSPVFGASAQVYQVNGGQPATIREIGMLVTTSAFNCQITFEQANRNDFGGGVNECDPNLVCPAHVDNTRYCEARSSFASYVEDAQGADNSSCISNRLKQQICRAGQLPSQFQITCR